MDSPRPEIADVIKRYCDQVRQMGIGVESVILFGANARDEAREGSDIDLLIVSPDFGPMNSRARLELLGVAAARIWQPVEAIGCTPEELASPEPATLLEEVLETGMRVV